MRRKTYRYLLRFASRVPGVYATLAFFVARRITVRGRSMAPALLPGERLLFDRLAYVRNRPRAGDVVWVAHPLRPELRMVKRLAGVPGDTIGGRTLGRGDYWVLGDNADESTDSREFGPVRRRDLLGRAWVRYWPAERWSVFK
ncbi:MAG TPA: signal peptidase I [Dehalococcoidia bacterium]|jgi:signal peptidase I